MYYVISFLCHSGKGKTIEKEIRSVVDRGWGGKEVDCKAELSGMTKIFYILFDMVIT